MRFISLLFVVFIDSLGFGIVFPIFFPLVVNNEGGFFTSEATLAFRGFLFGLLVSTFCIGQFFGSPLLGALSDRKGRKKVLIFSVWLGFIGYIIAALGIFFRNLTTIFLARLLCGLSAGNYGVAQSAIADISDIKEKTKNFGLIGMAWGVGFIIGPFLGGKSVRYGYTIPFLIAAVFCFTNLLLLKFHMKETISHISTVKSHFFSGIIRFHKAFKNSDLRGIFIVMFVCCLGWGFFTEFSPVFLSRRMGFSIEQIANFYAWMGLWIAICQGILIRPFLKRYSPQLLLSVALIGLGSILPVMLLLNGIIGLFWLIPLVSFAEALIFPTSATIVSNLAPPEMQGEIMGIQNSVQWAAIAISPMFSGSFVALYPHLSVTVCSICMVLAFFFFLWLVRRKDREVEPS